MRQERIFRDRTNPLDYEDDDTIISKFRLPRGVIFDLIDLLNADMPTRTRRTHAIHPSLQVMIALRYLATGSMYSTLGDSVGVSKASVSRIVRRFSITISRRAAHYIFFDINGLNQTSTEFATIADFPNVLGCVDGSQFAIKSPQVNEPAYVNRKGFHAINAQLVCDSNMVFSDIVVRYPGSTHDAFIFQFSGLHRRFREHELPDGWLLGDSGYPNLPFLLTPIGNPNTPNERRYNRAHKKTRVKVECAIGILKGRFLCLSRKLSGPLLFSPDISCKIISCCTCLHNIARRQGLPDPENNEPDDDGEEDNPEGILMNTGQETRTRLVNNRF